MERRGADFPVGRGQAPPATRREDQATLHDEEGFVDFRMVAASSSAAAASELNPHRTAAKTTTKNSTR